MFKIILFGFFTVLPTIVWSSFSPLAWPDGTPEGIASRIIDQNPRRLELLFLVYFLGKGKALRIVEQFRKPECYSRLMPHAFSEGKEGGGGAGAAGDADGGKKGK